MIQPSKLAVIMKFYSQKTVWKIKAKILFTNRANERPYEGTLYDLIQPLKLAVILKFYSQKTSLNKQGQNSFHNQSKWKAVWRISFLLDSAFKASCYSAILFTKKPVWMNKAEILSIIRAFLLKFYSPKTSWNKQGQNFIHKQSKLRAGTF